MSMIAKWIITCVASIGLVGLITVIVFESFTNSTYLPNDTVPKAFRFYQVATMFTVFTTLLCMGILLLRQINKYSTEKPKLLVLYLYFNIVMIFMGFGTVVAHQMVSSEVANMLV